MLPPLLNMEDYSYFQNIIESLSILHEYMDKCLLRGEPENDISDRTQASRHVISDTVQKITHLITKKAKLYQILTERNKMLETRVKTIAHLLRAVDKMTQLPEIPVLIKEENQSYITELAPEEEDNQLSVIAEITEPETNSNPGDSTLDGKSIGDNDVNVNLNHDEYLDQNEHLDEEHNQDAEMKDETSPPSQNQQPIQEPMNSNLCTARMSNRHNFETSTPKPTCQPNTGLENPRRKFFQKPTIIDKLIKPSTGPSGLPKDENGKENSEKELGIKNGIDKDHNQHDTISLQDSIQPIYSDISSDEEYLEDSKDEVQHNPAVKKPSSSVDHPISNNPIKFKLKEPVLNVDKLGSTEQLKKSADIIRRELQKSKREKYAKHGIREKPTAKKPGDNTSEEENYSDALSDISNVEDHELIDLTEVDGQEITHGRKPIRFNEKLEDKGTAKQTKIILTTGENNQKVEVNLEDEDDSDSDTEDELDEDDDNDDEMTEEIGEKKYQRVHAFWKPSVRSDFNLEGTTGDEDIELTATHIQNEENIDITQLRDQPITKTQDQQITKDQNQEIAKTNETHAVKESNQTIDLMTIRNYDSSSLENDTLSSTHTQSDCKDGDQNNMSNENKRSNETKGSEEKIKQKDEAYNKRENDDNASQRFEDSDEYDTDEEQNGNKGEVEATTFLSLTSKTIVYKVGENVNVLSDSFLNMKEREGDVSDNRKVVGDTRKANGGHETEHRNERRNGQRLGNTFSQHQYKIQNDDKQGISKTRTEYLQGNKSREPDEKDSKALERELSDASDMDDDKTHMDVEDTRQNGESENKIRHDKGNQKQMESKFENENIEESKSSAEEETLKPRRILRRRKIIEESSTDTEGDDARAKKKPKKQQGKSKQDKTKEEDEDNEWRLNVRDRPKRNCAKSRKLLESDEDKESIGPIKSKAKPRQRSHKRNG
ncbi:uncharacterized protein DDB_G0283697-like [Diaphorina citri]|uniref:Uncharacterized protein DDB_G0283697-like n=1 Tax=Diaphorina citri TaxID=121845 RepID=A0A3Q0IVG6_DIACI|nr:uncharacterized protein DDB_G0283697-like [Diaphorina citri]